MARERPCGVCPLASLPTTVFPGSSARSPLTSQTPASQLFTGLLSRQPSPTLHAGFHQSIRFDVSLCRGTAPSQSWAALPTTQPHNKLNVVTLWERGGGIGRSVFRAMLLPWLVLLLNTVPTPPTYTASERDGDLLKTFPAPFPTLVPVLWV